MEKLVNFFTISVRSLKIVHYGAVINTEPYNPYLIQDLPRE
ncbi:hypothetical protein J5U22_01770 [Saccharolobus shibatae]|uniref:Uncharacterized protein n=1 Tax=Saccharolobus shibatae TaxID=2286 RepID=A0A8F5C1A5_9CREN|nr:hypothetical protein J5U22_01770 [Saccharolobus shibatae]